MTPEQKHRVEEIRIGNDGSVFPDKAKRFLFEVIDAQEKEIAKANISGFDAGAFGKKLILDACCGGRMFWFNKAHPSVLYIDNRTAPSGHISLRPNHTVHPDQTVDFRQMPFPDKAFMLVVFDPPHILARKSDGIMAKRYGSLDRDTWRDDLAAGFSECWRVLADFGTLIFKWGESDIPLKEVLACFSEQPLFGHPSGSKSKTHWLCFMKIV